MEEINNQVKNHFKENRSVFDGKPIAFDGVVDEEAYLKSEIRTMFLLKDANEPNRTEDYVDYLSDIKKSIDEGKLYPMWRNACLYLGALNIKNLNFTDIINERKEIDYSTIKEYLRSVAIVNIKKELGHGSCPGKLLNKAIYDYKEIVVKEIEEIIKPQLVICGGTFDFSKKLFKDNIEVISLENGIEYYVHNGIKYFRFYHPSCRKSRELLFEYAKEVSKNLH